MRTYNYLLKRPTFILMIAASGFGLFLALNAIPQTTFSKSRVQSPPPDVRVRVRSYASNLKVIDLKSEENGSRIRVTLKNEYNKHITALVVNAISQRISSDFLPDVGIAPNATYETAFPIPPTNGEALITIAAVVLSDRTGDGDSRLINQIKEIRLGKKAQVQRIIPLLQSILNTPDHALSEKLAIVKSSILNLPSRSEQGVSDDFIVGLHNAKEHVIKDIERLEILKQRQGNSAFRENLIRIKEDYDNKVIKF
ncbi:MAG TPA: hypothetical protein VKA70_01405 [Blastocatellia bacterium]|nr:hypothetical protein [Blastocatellia bacterium]